jgi:hypothetical protein
MTDDSDGSENDKRYLEKAAVAQTPDEDPRDTEDITQVEDE